VAKPCPWEFAPLGGFGQNLFGSVALKLSQLKPKCIRINAYFDQMKAQILKMLFWS
jgi:hypothetical protein